MCADTWSTPNMDYAQYFNNCACSVKYFQVLVSKQKDSVKGTPKDKANLEVINIEPLVAKVNNPTNVVGVELKSIESISNRLFCKEKCFLVGNKTNSSVGKDFSYNKESDKK